MKMSQKTSGKKADQDASFFHDRNISGNNQPRRNQKYEQQSLQTIWGSSRACPRSRTKNGMVAK